MRSQRLLSRSLSVPSVANNPGCGCGVDCLWENETELWICGFCRSYVEGSQMSLNRLGRILQLNAIDLATVHSISPKMCSNCFRIRKERTRFELASEIISYRIFVWLVGPLLVFCILVLRILFSPLMWCRQLCCCCARKNPKASSECYYDAPLNAYLQNLSDEDALFDDDSEDLVWLHLQEARRTIDPYVLQNKINEHMLEIASDTVLTEFVFLNEFVRIHELPNASQVEPICKAIFNKMRKSDESIPLHLFRRFPFDAVFCLEEMQEKWVQCRKLAQTKRLQKAASDEKKEEKAEELENGVDTVASNECTIDVDESDGLPVHLAQCVNVRHFLRSIDNLSIFEGTTAAQRESILKAICKSNDYARDQGLYNKFNHFLQDVQSLLQDNSRNKTLLRDINCALNDRGIDLMVCMEELVFLCQNLNEILVLPLFNCMRVLCERRNSFTSRDSSKLYLWDIRNNLMCIDMVHQTVKEQLLHKHCTIKTSREALIKSVRHEFPHDIIKIVDDERKDDERANLDPSHSSFFSRMQTASAGNKRAHAFADEEDGEAPDVSRKRSSIHDLVDTDSMMSPMSPMSKSYASGGETPAHVAHLRIAQSQWRPSKPLLNMRAFLKCKITEEALIDIVEAMCAIMQSKAQISVTAVNAYYVYKIIRTEETLQYIFHQLKRYTAFHGERAQRSLCGPEEFRKILCSTFTFGDNYYIDEETVPLQLRSSSIQQSVSPDTRKQRIINDKQANIAVINALHRHCDSIYASCPHDEKEKPWVAQDDSEQQGLSIDTVPLLNPGSNSRTAQSDVFVPSLLNRGSNSRTATRSNKNLSLLPSTDCSPTRMSVGSIYSIVMLYVRIRSRVRAELEHITKLNTVDCVTFEKFVETQLLNKHDQRSGTRDIRSEATDLFYSVLCTQQSVISYGQIRNTVETLIDEVNGTHCGGIIRVMNHLRSCRTKDWIQLQQSEQNREHSHSHSRFQPRLNLEHFDDRKWHHFIEQIRSRLHHCHDSKLCNVCVHRLKAHDILIPERQNSNLQHVSNERCTSCSTHRTCDQKVFDRVLSFCRNVLTLQQLYDFSISFATFLKHNHQIEQLMFKYHESLHHTKRQQNLEFLYEKFLKKEFSLSKFKKKYFLRDKEGSDTRDSDADSASEHNQHIIEWLYEYSDTLHDLCFHINLFWVFSRKSNPVFESKPHGKMLLKIYDFMRDAKTVDGSYALSLDQFGLWKLDLGISEESAQRLFYIARRAQRTVSLKQLYGYLTFLLRMKYHVQDAILDSDQREDTTVSKLGLKMELKIKSDTDSEWLFYTVDEQHEGTLTWKQINEYLVKTLQLRKNVKDFFHENDKKQKWRENEAEIQFKMQQDQQSMLSKMENIEKGNNLSHEPSRVTYKDTLRRIEAVLNTHGKNGKLSFDAFRCAMQALEITHTGQNSRFIFDQLTKIERGKRSADESRKRAVSFAVEPMLNIEDLMKMIEEDAPRNCYQLSEKQICQIAMSNAL